MTYLELEKDRDYWRDNNWRAIHAGRMLGQLETFQALDIAMELACKAEHDRWLDVHRILSMFNQIDRTFNIPESPPYKHEDLMKRQT